MKLLFHVPVLVAGLLFTAPALHAQDDFAEWMQNGRPERVEAATPALSPAVAAPMHKVGSQASAPLTAIGSPKVPVVLVQFDDVKFSTPSENEEEVKAYYQTFCNGEGKAAGHNQYSIKDYFRLQSDGLFTPDFHVLGPVTLDSIRAYYGANSNTRKDVNFTNFCIESVKKVQEGLNVDWMQFDNDRDGSVDMVFFLFAGLGENNSGIAETIWPKETTNAQTINGIRYAGYGATGELRVKKRDENKEIIETEGDGIGVFCHELSHAMGLPDFYRTNNGEAVVGMDLLSIMDYGPYCGNGFTPVGYTAYEREFMGWSRLETLDAPAIVTLRPLSRGGVGYKVVNPANENEYYVLENRQGIAADSVLARLAHGLQVTHVDYNAGKWNTNTPNNDPEHQRMTFIAANNNYTTVGNAPSAAAWQAAIRGWLWPGDKLNHNLTDESTPASVVYTGGLMGQPIRNITENEDSTVTICFRTHGQLAKVGALRLAHVGDKAVTLEWDAVENATAYEVKTEESPSFTTALPSLTIEGLNGNTPYTFQVRAKADSEEDYLPGEWTGIEVCTVPTGISSAQTSENNATNLYDLQGRKVQKYGKKGIYIQGGKKIIK